MARHAREQDFDREPEIELLAGPAAGGGVRSDRRALACVLGDDRLRRARRSRRRLDAPPERVGED
ncbi:MAG: hypothetical protein ACK54X_18805, partial [Burkholderiales bacterium]